VVPFNLSGSSVIAQYNISQNLWKVHADPGQISQVITNLVINAKHAMPTGGTLTITARNLPAHNLTRDTDRVELIIGDSGIGMSQEIQNKIFDPYFTTKQDGSGLGLTMVYSIIDKHKGTITFESAPGKGTTFSIILDARDTTEDNIELAPAGAMNKDRNGALKILLIEDDHVVQDVLTDILTTSGNFVDVASEGETGIGMYKKASGDKEPYQLVISDLTIPGGMGGKEAVQKILEFNENAKVIVSSGYSVDPIMANYKKYGFCSAIVKPYQFHELSKVIYQVSG
jgi:CheY-like chemotaxis protein